MDAYIIFAGVVFAAIIGAIYLSSDISDLAQAIHEQNDILSEIEVVIRKALKISDEEE